MKRRRKRDERSAKTNEACFCLLSALTSRRDPFFYVYVCVYLCVFKTRVRARSFFVLCCTSALLRKTKALCFRVSNPKTGKSAFLLWKKKNNKRATREKKSK